MVARAPARWLALARRCDALRIGLVVALAACPGKPRTDEVARGLPVRGDAVPPGDAAPGDASPGHDAAAALPGAPHLTGDLQIRVEWPDVPAVARSSPGRTPCNTPRAPSVAPTTTWGVPDVLVMVDGVDAVDAVDGIDGDPRAHPDRPTARITLADCALTPRIAVGGVLAITSGVDRPAKLALRNRGSIDRLAAGDPIPVMLPIVGHTVTTALDAGAIYSLETDAADPEVAFIAAVPGGYLTDASGHVIARDIPVGAHTVTAWLPPRAGQPARVGRGSATVSAGDLAELTITLTR